jgi:UDP-N-acetylmuramoylalanine--D-glutamate ligase
MFVDTRTPVTDGPRRRGQSWPDGASGPGAWPAPGPLSPPVHHALDLLLGRCRAPVLAVAGTSGKSTTAALAAAMLRHSGRRVATGLAEALSTADFLGPQDRVVLELTPALAAHAPPGLAVLAVTGLAADELAPGQRLADLVAALRPAIRSAQAAVVTRGDDAQALALASTAGAPVWRTAAAGVDTWAWLRGGELILRDPADGLERRICRLLDTRLGAPGLAADLQIAATAAAALGARAEDCRRAALRFEPEPDTYHLVAVRRRVRWMADNGATRPGRTAATLAPVDGHLYLIAGGQDGGQPLARWAEAVGAHASAALLFGPAAEALATALRERGAATTIIRCASLTDGVLVARRLASAGDVVLFSPGCEPDELDLMTPGELFAGLVRSRYARRMEAA